MKPDTRAQEGVDAPRDDETAAGPAATNERIAELESRCEELNARWLRAQADYQNSRRRAAQELEAAVFSAMQPLLDELLLVSDYLDMALSAKVASEDGRALAGGVQQTRVKLVQALELANVRPLPTSGLFDPAQHEAVESRPSAEHPPGTILATLRPGFTWQGRILRPARVVVAVAPPGRPEGTKPGTRDEPIAEPGD